MTTLWPTRTIGEGPPHARQARGEVYRHPPLSMSRLSQDRKTFYEVLPDVNVRRLTGLPTSDVTAILLSKIEVNSIMIPLFQVNIGT